MRLYCSAPQHECYTHTKQRHWKYHFLAFYVIIHSQSNILRAPYTSHTTHTLALCGRWRHRKVREYYSISRSKYLHAVNHQKELNEIYSKMYLLLGVPIYYIWKIATLKNLIIHHSRPKTKIEWENPKILDASTFFMGKKKIWSTSFIEEIKRNKTCWSK